MNIRIKNLNGELFKENEVYFTKEPEIVVRLKTDHYYEVANDEIKDSKACVGIKSTQGNYELVFYGDKNTLEDELRLLSTQLNDAADALEAYRLFNEW